MASLHKAETDLTSHCDAVADTLNYRLSQDLQSQSDEFEEAPEAPETPGKTKKGMFLAHVSLLSCLRFMRGWGN